MKMTMLTLAFTASLLGCSRGVPQKVCVAWGNETTVVPVLVSIQNNTPQYIYMPQTNTVCVAYRRTTPEERQEWCRNNPDGKGC